jgi:hypothetical protein
MRSRCMSLLPRTTLHSDSEQLDPAQSSSDSRTFSYVYVRLHNLYRDLVRQKKMVKPLQSKQTSSDNKIENSILPYYLAILFFFNVETTQT